MGIGKFAFPLQVESGLDLGHAAQIVVGGKHRDLQVAALRDRRARVQLQSAQPRRLVVEDNLDRLAPDVAGGQGQASNYVWPASP